MNKIFLRLIYDDFFIVYDSYWNKRAEVHCVNNDKATIYFIDSGERITVCKKEVRDVFYLNFGIKSLKSLEIH